MPWFDIFENSGSRIVAVALMSIPANGNSRYPLLNAAKSFYPEISAYEKLAGGTDYKAI